MEENNITEISIERIGEKMYPTFRKFACKVCKYRWGDYDNPTICPKCGNDLVIRPKLDNIGCIDWGNAEKVLANNNPNGRYIVEILNRPDIVSSIGNIFFAEIYGCDVYLYNNEQHDIRINFSTDIWNVDLIINDLLTDRVKKIATKNGEKALELINGEKIK